MMRVQSPGNWWSWPVSRVLSRATIHLGYVSPHTSCDLPESSAGHAIRFLFGLAPDGVYHRHRLLPAARCALTTPFHPYRATSNKLSFNKALKALGGLLSAALSVGSHLPGVTWRPTLWSPDFPLKPTNKATHYRM